MIRYARFQIPAVAPAARTGPTNVVTFDDAKPRRLLGFLTSNQTRLIHTQIDIAGRVFADIDHGLAAQQRDFIPVDQQFDSGIIISVNVINDSAAALLVNTDAIVVKYDAPPSS